MPKTSAPSAQKIDAADDVAPLVAAAKLQPATGAAKQLEEIDRLQDHVVELEEAQVLLLLQPRPDTVEGEHAVDGEMFADVPEHVDPGHPVEPVGIVDHDSIGRPVAEGQQPLEHFPDAGDIGRDFRLRQHRPRRRAKTRITDARGAAADQHDRLVAGLLQPPQRHDRHEMADMQTVRRRIEAGINRHDTGREGAVDALKVGHLVDITALDQRPRDRGTRLKGIGGIVGYCHRYSPWHCRQGALNKTKPPDGGLFQGMIETRRSLWGRRIIGASDVRGFDHAGGCSGDGAGRQVLWGDQDSP
uniref:Uncharacterized protein n=1 Tax=Ensifer adhaerens TaxID=106592 RepID=I0FXA2_ENSAD|nr:hypothetical protein [Ensifer adhaerens]